jgi:lauroyl/myristoyl acyltransferase
MTSNMPRPRRAPQKNILNHPWSYRFSLAVARFMPLSFLHFVTRIIAILWYRLDRNTINQVESNLSRVIGYDPVLLHKTSKELFLNYAAYLADWAKLVAIDTSEVFSFFNEIEGLEILEEAYAKNKGIIILAAHLGNWELGGLVFTHSGMPFNIITAKDEAEAVAKVRTKVRALHNINTITIEEGPFFLIDILNALKRSEVVAMLVDRYEQKNGILVDFFGEKTYFPKGPALLAKATGAVIIPSFTVIDVNKKYKSILGAPIKMEWSEDEEKDLYFNVTKIANIFEQYIRLYPNQWFNFSAIWDK